MAAKRKNVCHSTAKAGSACCDKRQPAAEAHPHQPQAAVWSQPRVGRQKDRRLLNRVGQRRRDDELGQLRNIRRDDRHAARGELTRKGNQPRVVVPPGMQTAYEQASSSELAGRLVTARPQGAGRRWNVQLSLTDGLRIQIGEGPQDAS